MPKQCLSFVIRALDDGVAFHYELPAQTALGDFKLASEKSQFRRVHGQSVAAMVEVAWMVNGCLLTAISAEIPVKESREIRHFLRLVGTYFRGRRLRDFIRRARHVSHKDFTRLIAARTRA